MSLQKAVANALSFAHLNGFRRKSRAAAEGDDTPDDKDKGAKAEGDDDGDEEGDGKPDHDGDEPLAEDDGDGESAEGNDDEPADDKEEKGAKARAKARSSKPAAKTYAQGIAAGRAEERKRCASIFASPAAARNVALAAELAFGTDMAAERVVAVLGKAPSQASADRASRNPQAVSRGSREEHPGAAVASSWDAALQKAAGTFKR